MPATRREFTKLLGLAPLAFMIKPEELEPYELRCEVCQHLMGFVEPTWRIRRVGTVWCKDHSGWHELGTPGIGLVTDFYFEPIGRHIEVLV